MKNTLGDRGGRTPDFGEFCCSVNTAPRVLLTDKYIKTELFIFFICFRFIIEGDHVSNVPLCQEPSFSAHNITLYTLEDCLIESYLQSFQTHLSTPSLPL